MLFRSRLSARFTLLLLLVFLIGVGLSGAALYLQLQSMGQEWVRSNGLLLLQGMNAVRTYTSGQVDPLLNPVMNERGTFIPETVPAFSARSVFGNLRGQGYEQYKYKEAALNPSAPEDRADAFETELLMRFRNDPTLHEISGFRTLDGQLTYYSARPMAITNQACLACHSTPAEAPPAMLERYGPVNGFGWKMNEVVATQVVYAPAAEVYDHSRSAWLSVMGISMASFAIAVLAVNLVLRRSVVSPIKQMAELAQRIRTDEVDESAPDRLADVAKRSDELGQMALVFQRMAHEVYAREQSLKLQVQELRIEIDEVKKARQVAALVDTDTFQDLRAKAKRLREQKRGSGTMPSNNDSTPPTET